MEVGRRALFAPVYGYGPRFMTAQALPIVTRRDGVNFVRPVE